MAKEKQIENIIYYTKKHDDWHIALERRQLKFVRSLLRHPNDLSSIAKECGYTKEDMLSIFSRIERSLVKHDQMKRNFF